MNDMTYVSTSSETLLSVCDGRFRAVLLKNFPGQFTLFGPMLCEYGRVSDFAAAEAEAVAWLKEEAAKFAEWRAMVAEARAGYLKAVAEVLS